jgi:hypothetical protein
MGTIFHKRNLCTNYNIFLEEPLSVVMFIYFLQPVTSPSEVNCKLTSHASLPSAPAQIEVSGSENLVPNCCCSALSQAEFCHSGTFTSFRTTECSDAETIITQCKKHEER